MTDQNDTHEKIVRVCQEYIKNQNKFEHKGSDEAGIQARNYLSELRELCTLRRGEIQAKRKERKKLRNSKNGRPTNITIGTYK
jgi:hypothetical protein